MGSSRFGARQVPQPAGVGDNKPMLGFEPVRGARFRFSGSCMSHLQEVSESWGPTASCSVACVPSQDRNGQNGKACVLQQPTSATRAWWGWRDRARCRLIRQVGGSGRVCPIGSWCGNPSRRSWLVRRGGTNLHVDAGVARAVCLRLGTTSAFAPWLLAQKSSAARQRDRETASAVQRRQLLGSHSIMRHTLPCEAPETSGLAKSRDWREKRRKIYPKLSVESEVGGRDSREKKDEGMRVRN